jgi:hypothetical protein
MAYMLVIYGDQTAWQTMSEHQRGQVLHLHASLVAELRRSGELIAGAGLADPEDTMIVRRCAGAHRRAAAW